MFGYEGGSMKPLAARMRADGVTGLTSGTLKDVLDMAEEGHLRTPAGTTARERGLVIRARAGGYVWAKPGWDGTSLVTKGAKRIGGQI